MSLDLKPSSEPLGTLISSSIMAKMPVDLSSSRSRHAWLSVKVMCSTVIPSLAYSSCSSLKMCSLKWNCATTDDGGTSYSTITHSKHPTQRNVYEQKTTSLHLQLLVTVVDAQLLERVDNERLETEDIQDTDRQMLLLGGRRRRAHLGHQCHVDLLNEPVEHLAIQALRSHQPHKSTVSPCTQPSSPSTPAPAPNP